MGRSPERALLLWGLLLCPGCLTLSWSRVNIDAPVPPDRWRDFQEGKTGLSECLERLGAPSSVREWEDGGLLLLYTWYDEGGWGLSLSPPRLGAYIPISPTFGYNQSWEDAKALCLEFDSRLVLKRIQEGYMSKLAEGSGESDYTPRRE